ncbi:MAG TPA: DUF4159 domain-containing protein [Candidatus Latescibacteria bacterium]|jgi:hypothetical protein|nr:DUF4159 domain-containing protein [Candidatus Latescibacterota bacterium]HJP32994.1 DUF4159 domain-containing protein [Candidatus Latescibacterota bacterium]
MTIRPHGLIPFALLSLVALATAQPPDSLVTDTRVELPTIEPERQPRHTAGVHRLVALKYARMAEGTDHFSAALPELAAFLDSDVEVADTRFVSEEHDLGSFSFEGALLVMLTGNRATLNPNDTQKKRLGAYLRGGGLLFAEDVRSLAFFDTARDVGQSGTPFDRQLKALIADPQVLERAGRNWRPVARNHPLYRSYFQFPAGPPMSGTAGGRLANARVTELEQLEYRGRVAVVFSDLNISFAWSTSEAVGRQRSLQFGANLVIFALAQYAAGDVR